MSLQKIHYAPDGWFCWLFPATIRISSFLFDFFEIDYSSFSSPVFRTHPPSHFSSHWEFSSSSYSLFSRFQKVMVWKTGCLSFPFRKRVNIPFIWIYLNTSIITCYIFQHFVENLYSTESPELLTSYGYFVLLVPTLT